MGSFQVLSRELIIPLVLKGISKGQGGTRSSGWGLLKRAVIFGDAFDIVHMFIYTSTLDIDSRLVYSDFDE